MITVVFFMAAQPTNITFIFNAEADAKAAYNRWLEAMNENAKAIIEIADDHGKRGAVVAGMVMSVVIIDQDKDRALAEELNIKGHMSTVSWQRRANDEATRLVVPSRRGPIVMTDG